MDEVIPTTDNNSYPAGLPLASFSKRYRSRENVFRSLKIDTFLQQNGACQDTQFSIGRRTICRRRRPRSHDFPCKLNINSHRIPVFLLLNVTSKNENIHHLGTRHCHCIDTMKGNIQPGYSSMTFLFRSFFDHSEWLWHLSWCISSFFSLLTIYEIFPKHSRGYFRGQLSRFPLDGRYLVKGMIPKPNLELK